MNSEKRLVVFEDFIATGRAKGIISSIRDYANKVIRNYNALGIQPELNMNDIGSLAGQSDEGIERSLRERVFRTNRASDKTTIGGLEIEESHLLKMIKLPNYSEFRSSLRELNKAIDGLHQFRSNEQYRSFANGSLSMLKVVNGVAVIDENAFQAECDRSFRIIVTGESKVRAFQKIEEFCAFMNLEIVGKSHDPNEWMRPGKLAGDLFAFNPQQKRFEVNPSFFKQ